jgi:hypothetical protein
MLDDSVKTFDFQSVWKARKTRDEARHYYINPDHALIKDALEKEAITKQEFKRVLSLIGETTPVESIIQYHSEEPESHELRDSSRELDQGTIEVATMMYESLKTQGLNQETATKQIFNIEPFNQFPELEQYFN